MCAGEVVQISVRRWLCQWVDADSLADSLASHRTIPHRSMVDFPCVYLMSCGLLPSDDGAARERKDGKTISPSHKKDMQFSFVSPSSVVPPHSADSTHRPTLFRARLSCRPGQRGSARGHVGGHRQWHLIGIPSRRRERSNEHSEYHERDP